MKYYLDTQPHIWWVFSTLPLTVQFVEIIYMYYDTIEYLQNKGWKGFPIFQSLTPYAEIRDKSSEGRFISLINFVNHLVV